MFLSVLQLRIVNVLYVISWIITLLSFNVICRIFEIYLTSFLINIKYMAVEHISSYYAKIFRIPWFFK